MNSAEKTILEIITAYPAGVSKGFIMHETTYTRDQIQNAVSNLQKENKIIITSEGSYKGLSQ